MVDCGAIGNLTGKNFVDRQGAIAERAGHKVRYEQLAQHVTVNGIGQGSPTATTQAVVPIQLNDELAGFIAPVLTGNSASTPALWGLQSQRQARAIIDVGGNSVILPGPGGFTITLSPGSKVIRCENAI